MSVQFFQREREPEVQFVKRNPIEAEAARQLLSSEVAELVTRALAAAAITPTQAALHMGISLSLFLRQLQNQDNQHVSLQRLFRLPDAFWRELLVLLAERRKLAQVQRRIVLEL
jgi:hypothetical protein